MLQPITWVLLALIHTTPALALVRPSLLTSLYRLTPDNPLFVLMHHRAALFAGILLICLWCAVDAAPRRLGACVVALSMISFPILYWKAGYPRALRQIAMVDLVGLIPLTYVLWTSFDRR